MPYNVIIQDNQGNPLRGTVTFFDGGEAVGEAHGGPEVFRIEDGDFPVWDHFRVEVDGYYWYGSSTLYDDNVFTLQAKPPVLLYAVLGAAAVFLLFK